MPLNVGTFGELVAALQASCREEPIEHGKGADFFYLTFMLGIYFISIARWSMASPYERG